MDTRKRTAEPNQHLILINRVVEYAVPISNAKDDAEAIRMAAKAFDPVQHERRCISTESNIVQRPGG